MSNFLKNLKEELDEISDVQPMITVKRSDLEGLIKAHEKRPGMDAVELEAVVRALRYWESDFGMTDKEHALLDRMQNDLKGMR